MSKVILEFNLPEEDNDFREAVDGWKWKMVVKELKEHLRGQIKHNNSLTSEQYEILDKTKDFLLETISCNGLNID